jgi:hypothetical protein
MEARIIRILGSGKERDREIEHYREFYCYGRQDIDNVCGNCRLRFICFTDREQIEIPMVDLRKRSVRNVTVKNVVEKWIENNVAGMVRYTKDKEGKGHAKINFSKVVKK